MDDINISLPSDDPASNSVEMSKEIDEVMLTDCDDICPYDCEGYDEDGYGYSDEYDRLSAEEDFLNGYLCDLDELGFEAKCSKGDVMVDDEAEMRNGTRELTNDDAMDDEEEVVKEWELTSDDAMDEEEVVIEWEVMFINGGDECSDAMEEEVRRMNKLLFIDDLMGEDAWKVYNDERLPPQGSWSRPSRFLAFSKTYGSQFRSLMKSYERNGVYQLEEMLQKNCQIAMPGDKDILNRYDKLEDPDQLFYKLKELEEMLPKICQIAMPDDKDILNRYDKFERFAKVVEDPDRSFYKLQEEYMGIWEKGIRKEWMILEKELPETIYVRAYESRMDLLRAVIIGPRGTPYHDGLFFFDVHFPPLYPQEPPILRYHSFGFAINPRISKCGEVRYRATKTACPRILDMCLSRCTTVLELLLSIQNNILKEDPLFLQPGMLYSGPSVVAEYFSLLYNEDILIKSLKTMMHIIYNPPKHFEDFVVGHFLCRSHQIIKACEAYMSGDLEAGGVVASVGKRDSLCSPEFQKNVRSCFVDLKNCFKKMRATETKISDG